MVILEMREAAQEKAFELLDELHELGHQKKMVMCELEDTLYDCFEDSKESEENEEGLDLGFKSKSRGYRNFEDEEYERPEKRHRSLRMRRHRMRRAA